MGRIERVSEAIRQEVSLIVHDKLKDPRLGFITITRVEMSGDLRLAKIYFSVLGKTEDYKKTKEALDSALGLIRTLIAERVNLRFAPEVIFYEDRSSEYSVRIQEVLNEIKELNQAEPPDKKKIRAKRTRKEKAVEPGKSRRSHKKT